MKAFLEMPEDRRRLVCQQAAERLNLFEASVEKDFWVCWTLRTLWALPEIGPHLTFKGGTSLSKGWKLIDRFSEDIDLVIDRPMLDFGGASAPGAAPSRKQTKKRLEALRAAAQKWIAAVVLPQLKDAIAQALPEAGANCLFPDTEDSDGQTLLFEYPTAFPDQPRYLRQVVKIEMRARSDTEPAATVRIQPMIAEVFPELLADADFEVNCVGPERTFWEKALLLHEEGCRPADKQQVRPGMARHYYDLHRLIESGIADQARNDTSLFQRIVEHRRIYFRYAWMDYDQLGPGTLRLVPVENRLADWRNDYAAMRTEMLYGESPDFADILQRVQDFEDSFNQETKTR